MVDFRYHLVSLVSVFMALAVGVILGAGPLQNSIGTTLTSQVKSLRESRDEARSEADAAKNALSENEKQLDLAGTQLVDGTLKGRKIGVVALPGVEDSELGAAENKISKAGGTIAGTVTITDTYTSSSETTYRKSLAGNLSQYVGEKADADAETVIASAISRILFTGTADANSTVIVEALTAKDRQIIQIQGDLGSGVDAVVIVAPAKLEVDKSTPSPSVQKKNISAGYSKLVHAFGSKGATVTTGEGTSSDNVVAKARQAKAGSTVDSLDTITGRINVAIAVASEIKGTHVQLGKGDGAQATLGARVDAAETPAATPEPDPASEG